VTHKNSFTRGILRGSTALSALTMFGAGLAASVVAAAPVAAQDYTRGSLEGTVRSAEGTPLPSAAVTLRSNEQGFTRDTTTDENGTFRFNLLPTGSYTLTVRGAGGESVVDPALSVVAGQTNTFTYTAVAAGTAPPTETSDAGEEIVVLGQREQTTDFGSTTTGITLDVTSTVESIPIPRSQTGLILLAPGTVEGDTGFADCVDCVSIGGATIAENSYYVNGLNTTNFRTLVGNNTVPFEFYRTFEVKTGGYSAEFGRALGGVTSAVVKSGSNRFEAGAVIAYSPDAFQKDSPNTFSDATGAIKQRNQDDFTETLSANFYASGPIIKDRLFFFGLYNPRYNRDYDSTSTNRFLTKSRDPFFGGKLDFVITDGHRLEGMYFRDTRDVDTDILSVSPTTGAITGGNGRSTATSGGDNYIAQYTGSFTDWLTISAAYGENNFARRDVFGTETPVVQSQLGGVLVTSRGPAGFSPTESDDRRRVYRADADLYVKLFGEHHFRFGFDREDLQSIELTRYNGQYVYRFTPTYIRTRFYRNEGNFTSRQTAFYIQDSWDLFNERLNLQLGLRNDSYDNQNVEGETYLSIKNQWAPRLGASFDVFGDKRTKINAFFGRYYLPVPTNTNIRLAGAEIFYEQRYSYRPGVNSAVFDANRVPIGQQFDASGAPLLGPLTGQNTLPCPTTGPNAGQLCRAVFSEGIAGPTDTLVAENLKPMVQDEYILGASHRMNDWTFALNYTKRRLVETLEDVAIDAAVLKYCAAQKIPGCADAFTGFHQYVLSNPGKDITVRLDGDCAVSARQCEVVTLSAADLGYPKPIRKLDQVEFSTRKAFNGLYSFDFSYTWQKLRGNYEGSVKSDNNQDDAGLTQDFDQPGLTEGAFGHLANERKHSFKVFGYVRPLDWMSVGANLTVRSPRHFSCIGLHPTDEFAQAYGAASFYCANPAGNGGSTTSTLVPRGSAFKSEWYKNLDLGVQFELPGALSGSSFRIDMFNVFNWQDELDAVEFGEFDSGAIRPDYGFVTGYQTPRSVRFTRAMRFGAPRRRANPVISGSGR
jgi:hypothetical protein